MPPGKKNPAARSSKVRTTIVDIAKVAGCTPMTVSRILRGMNGHSAETCEDVRRIASSMNYRPSLLARGLRTQNSRIVACLTPDLPEVDYISDIFYSRIMMAVEAELARRGYRTLLVSVSPEDARSERGLDVVEEGLVQSAVVVGPQPASFLKMLHKQLKSLVTVDFLLEGISGVASSNREGGWLAARAFWEAGHRSFSAVTHGDADANYSLRLDGFAECLRRTSGESINLPVFSGNVWREDDHSAAEAFCRAKCCATAVFCVNDHLAIDFIKGLRLHGIEVPGEVSVCGYDDILLAAHIPTPLTTIAVDKVEMGKRAVELLLDQLNDNSPKAPMHLEIPVRLLMRQTVAPRVSAWPMGNV